VNSGHPAKHCRAAKVTIDLVALKHNFKQVQKHSSNGNIMPVIKANAYGHGMLQVADALDGANGFAVAQLGEAIALREHGVSKPITVFQGFADSAQLELMIQYNLRPVVTQLWQIDLLESLNTKSISTGATLVVWLKVNTGMGRLGVQPDDVMLCWQRLQQIPHIQPLGLMMHFANADQPDKNSNQLQLNCFKRLSDKIVAQTSVSNSAAIVSHLCEQEDWVRPGIMLYGSSPVLNVTAQSLGLQAVMSLHAELIAINHLPKGHHVGYGDSWTCPDDMSVGIVNVGYGDGYPRLAPSGTPVMVNNQLTQLVGRVSMDSIAVDLRGINAQCGAHVELWGRHISVDEVALKSGTISYELLCNVGRL
jgi:alanine racemase